MCRLAAQIASELRNKTPEHFVDELALADLCAFLEHAARYPSDRKPEGRSRNTYSQHYRDGVERSFRRRDLWRHFNRLLRLLCSIHFFWSACTMARLWHRRDLHLDDDRRISRGAAQLPALHHSRTRQLHLCRHCDPRGCLCPVARRKQRDRPYSWVNAVSYGAELDARWNSALRTRTGKGGPRGPLRVLPGDWRVPRGDRMADGFRCESGHYRHAACRCQHSCAPQSRKPLSAHDGGSDCRLALFRVAPL